MLSTNSVLKSLTLLGVLTLAVASKSPDEVETELRSYAQSQIVSVFRRPGLGRSGGGMACYEKYLPLINGATANSKTETETCNNLATTRREDELNKVKDQRVTLDNQVNSVQGTLSICAQMTDALEFLTCLKDSSIILQSNIEQVTKTSTALADGLSGAYATIDNSENLCIEKVMNKVKSDTDAITTALQSCLLNGFDGPQPEVSSSTSTSAPLQPSEEPGPNAPESGEESSTASPESEELTPDNNLLPEEHL